MSQDQFYPIVRLKESKSHLISKQHPWIFSGAVQGDLPFPLVYIADAQGEIVATGLSSNNQSSIAVRILAYEKLIVDTPFFLKRLSLAIDGRKALGLYQPDTACRLVNAEADGLPGLIIDQYADALVIQVHTAALEALRDIWLPAFYTFGESLGIKVFVERSTSGRKKEGLQNINNLMRGSLSGPVVIREGSTHYSVNLLSGQKTGLFLDQKDNRLLIRDLSTNKMVLNVFCYTGGFSLQAAQGGARSVTSVDISAAALESLKTDWIVNNLSGNSEVICDDAFNYLRNEKRKFDIVIIDPPAFAKEKKDVSNAFKAYKDLFREGSKLVGAHGLLCVFSCSQYMPEDRFGEALWSALLESGRHGKILKHLGPSLDHGYDVNHPEGRYLKGLLIQLS